MATIKLKQEYFLSLIIIFCVFLMFKYPDAIKSGVNEGLNICFYTIIPSLFPFMTLSSYIVKSNILSPIYKIFSLPVKLFFKQPACTVSVIILSMIGGFPIGIKMTNDLYLKGQITKEQSQRLCLFCINAGPAFIISAVGVNMLKSIKAGVIIYTSLCISSLVSGVISSSVAENNNGKIVINNGKPLQASSISASVTDSLQCILSICAWVVLCSSITMCLKIFNIPKQLYLYTASVFEITKGCSLLCGKIPIPIMTGLISFGGICVHCQVLEYLKNIEIKYSYFFISRLLNGVLSGIISCILLIFFPVELNVFSNANEITSYSFSLSYSAFFVFMLMCIVMIFDIDRYKKYGKMS